MHTMLCGTSSGMELCISKSLGTRTIYYLDEALYHYRIGRADQSVNVQVQLKNIDQQIMVDKRITDIYVNRPQDLSK